MIETRMEAAGIALQGETQRFVSRMQLKLAAAAGIFFAVWAGIVLLAVALPEEMRVPVLATLVGAFVVLAIVAQVVASRRAASREPGSMSWFADALRKDLELVSRVLSRPVPPARTKSSVDGGPPHDLAA
jgi:uncharacterized membrane protein YqjE